MSKKAKQIAMNTHLWLPALLLVVFLMCAVGSVHENMIGLAIGFGIACLLPVFVFMISPLYFVFSNETIEIVYPGGQKEEIKWSSIRSITKDGAWMNRGSGTPHYHIAYPQNKKLYFFMSGNISKTGKTQKLIKEYYQNKIV